MVKSEIQETQKTQPSECRMADIDKLEIGKYFENNTKDALQSKQIMVDGNINVDWEKIREALSNADKKTLGTQKLKSEP